MRLFVALDLPWEARERLASLGGGIPGARWTPTENLHMTLRFIGEVDKHQAEEIDGALAAIRARPFPLTLTGVGLHSRGHRAFSLWAGVARDEAFDRLLALQAKVETALQRAGFEPERRRYAPHVTLARLDGAPEAKLAAFVQANNLLRIDLGEVAHFTLFSSRLGKEQSAYTAEVEYPLA